MFKLLTQRILSDHAHTIESKSNAKESSTFKNMLNIINIVTFPDDCKDYATNNE